MAAKTMSAGEIRSSFLEFFRSKGHEIVPSSPVVLPADPSLLFVNAGMNQFKDIFLGARASAYRRVANSQKCIRVSGKHNDLEEVGHDTYHHTFFEMLGNWSFGDYYKRESIQWGWELLTTVWRLPKERLWATVYKEDEEAAAIWRDITNIEPSHVLRFGEKDNFWEMGETGPCGPCSEIHFDRTEGGCGPEMVNAGRPEVIEIWNHVFIQYNRRADGSLEELPSKHVDTGMGLERVSAVIQGRPSNYDTDLFMPIIRAVERVSGRSYVAADAVAMRVIADHLRALAFAMADGVMPSNEGRGYVLRRLLRRAVRYGRRLGMTQPFMAELFPTLEAAMGEAYPELKDRAREIVRALRAEETSFAETLDRGIETFEETASRVLAGGQTVFPGEEAFRLYDTYGFPLDLTMVMAAEKGLTVDQAAFDRSMEAQRRRARGARKAAASPAHADLVSDLVSRGLRTVFTGYRTLEQNATVIGVVRVTGESVERVEALAEGEEGLLLLSETPFYAEKGGQLGDHGHIASEGGRFDVRDTRSPAEGIVFHVGRIAKGRVAEGQTVRAVVTDARRQALARHHTATHLLQYALRTVVGTGVSQAGSYVGPDRLRFDFNWFEALSKEQVDAVERMVNELIMADDPVTTTEMALKDIPGSGIIALFDEKYGDTVRVVSVNGYSRELCGGTHVARTGEIGAFRILAESSIASGVRRIEAAAGLAAYELARNDRALLEALAARLSVAPSELPARMEAMTAQIKSLEKELRERERAALLGRAETIAKGARDVKGVRLAVAALEEVSGEALQCLAEAVLAGMGSGVVVLGSGVAGGKAQFVGAISRDLVERGLHAGRLIKEVARVAGGSGGGQPGLARAGGKDAAKVPEAIASAADTLVAML